MGETTIVFVFLIFDFLGVTWIRLMKLKPDDMQRILVGLYKNGKRLNANTIVGKVLRSAFAAFAEKRGAPMLAAA